MANSSPDQYLEHAKQTYGGMLKLTKVAIAATIIILVGMVIFLV